VSWDAPDWWAFVLLFLAAYRSWRLIALDAIFDRWRQPVLRRVPEKLHQGVECPFCFGAWFAIGWWLAWIVSHDWATIIATPFALSAAVGIFAAQFDPD
jgi:hypothetical protein